MSEGRHGINGFRGALRAALRQAKRREMNRNIEGFAVSLALPDLAATEALGARIAAGLERGGVVALEGDLGAGKTTLARAILRALGVRDAVPSPTFTLAQHYDAAKIPVTHYDLYRIEKPGECEELGLEESLATGAALIEWPEHAGDRLPADTLHVHLEMNGADGRRARLSGPVRWAGAFSRAASDAE